MCTENSVLNTVFKDFRYTNENQTKILYRKFNYYTFKVKILSQIGIYCFRQTKSESKIYIIFVTTDLRQVRNIKFSLYIYVLATFS